MGFELYGDNWRHLGRFSSADGTKCRNHRFGFFCLDLLASSDREPDIEEGRIAITFLLRR